MLAVAARDAVPLGRQARNPGQAGLRVRTCRHLQTPRSQSGIAEAARRTPALSHAPVSYALHHTVLIHAMHLKDLLRNVQPAASKLHLDSPCSVIEQSTVFNLAQPMP